MISKNQRFFTYIEANMIRNLQWESGIRIGFYVELFSLAINFLEYFYLYYLLIYIHAMHRNMHILLSLYAGQYCFSMIFRIGLIYFQLNMITDPDPTEWFFLTICNYGRLTCLCIAFYMLPILVFERCFATYFSGSYEKNKHVWIPCLLISIMLPIAVFSAFAYINRLYPVIIQCLLFISSSIGGEFLLMKITKWNNLLHGTTLGNGHLNTGYSLSERFQISENIKICKWLSQAQVSIFVCNVFCSIILMLDYFTMNPKLVTIAYISFNFAAIIYAIVVPIFFMYWIPEWNRKTKKLFNLRCSGKVNNRINLRSTHGQEMVYNDKNAEAQYYFEKLKRDLETKSI